ncbi:hypothetical protein CU633_21770 [Bacillus sp. V3-13]|uniref:PqqD family peptide modification chaperone n=1 Tax=Bacillus sp. V3-13 TaxID=2053728 RepID=UPI000C78EE25|nr:PqqD family peptide modification chaperone [Bacillus sp. V3-13]PLR75314.1 hypothetical protein CU633_21770 [Bacillus sp. V3-13]
MYLSKKDIPSFPKQVTLQSNFIRDKSFDEMYPINETGNYILSLVDGSKTIGEIIKITKKKYKITEELAHHDCATLFEKLNQEFLLNIKRKGVSDRIAAFWFYLKTFQFRQMFEFFQLNKRFDNTYLKKNILVTFLYLLIITPYFNAGLLLMVFLFLFLSNPVTMWEPFLLGGSFVLSIAIHEFSHVLGLYGLGEMEKIGFIGKRNLNMGIFRKRVEPKKDILVSLMGPVIPSFIGYALFELSTNGLIQTMGIFWMFNLFTLFSTDGKNIRDNIKKIMRGAILNEKK